VFARALRVNLNLKDPGGGRVGTYPQCWPPGVDQTDPANLHLRISHGKCWRGGGLPDQHRPWFTVGKKFRVKGFLATTVNETRADFFMGRAEGNGHPVVKWIIRVSQDGDPHGNNEANARCKHANHLQKSHASSSSR
jgi:hypothetical protein